MPGGLFQVYMSTRPILWRPGESGVMVTTTVVISGLPILTVMHSFVQVELAL